MSTKYHVNPKTGKANKCSAVKRACSFSPVGEPERHWDNYDLAREGYNALLPENPTFVPFDEEHVKKALTKSSGGGQSVYARTEQHVADLFDPNKQEDGQPVTVHFKSQEWTSQLSAKPVAAGGGEGKTDVYVMLKNEDGEELEIKLSIKQSNADFIENKVSTRRAREIFGDNFESVMKPYLDDLADKAEIHHTPVTDNHITLGLRIDMENKGTRPMSTEMSDLPRDTKIEIYAGNRLTPEKLHSKVNGEVIPHSGASNYIIHGDMEDFTTAQVVMDRMVLIEDYVDDPNSPKLYMSAGAVNYRQGGKFDGARPLGVVMRYLVDSKTGEITDWVFTRDNPLSVNSTQAAKALPEFLRTRYGGK